MVLSIDALAEQRLRETLDPGSIPNLLALFDGGACAGATAAFPTLTAPGHAALWTGAYGDVTGIAGNWQPRLPRDRHTLLEGVSGYFADGLRAEPIWVTAARAGLAVGAHHVTQAPHAPHFPEIRSGAEPELAARRAEADTLLSGPGTLVMNGYNRMIAPDAVITEQRAAPRPARGWAGMASLGSGVPPLEISWSIAGDSIHALLLGGVDGYDRAIVAPARDAAAGISVSAVRVDTVSPVGRPLARYFSEPLHLVLEGSPVSLRFRLFSVAPDGQTFRLFHTAAPRVDVSDPALAAEYVREIGGWIGNASLGLLRSGAFGTPLSRGGDGVAEAHRRYPGHDAAVAARAQRVRERGWALVDRRLALLRALMDDGAGTALFVSGDHGMRPAWRVFRPNVALREAGLLHLDDSGTVDLTRTVALSPNGYWININGTDWKGGIVSPGERAAVIRRVERMLRDARGVDGEPIVTRIWRTDQHPDLGVGGPAGGDLYFDLRLGYHVSHDASGPMTRDTRPEGKHGYPPMASDMHTSLCIASPLVGPQRLDLVRTIDLAPTVATWLGIDAPPESRGRSLLPRIRMNGSGR